LLVFNAGYCITRPAVILPPSLVSDADYSMVILLLTIFTPFTSLANFAGRILFSNVPSLPVMLLSILFIVLASILFPLLRSGLLLRPLLLLNLSGLRSGLLMHNRLPNLLLLLMLRLGTLLTNLSGLLSFRLTLDRFTNLLLLPMLWLESRRRLL
jgi:hypothetical protein